MTTSNLNMMTKLDTWAGAVRELLGRPQPRWLAWLAGGFALIVLAKITLAAGQIIAIVNATYAAGLT
jgi:hypothetical protein